MEKSYFAKWPLQMLPWRSLFETDAEWDAHLLRNPPGTPGQHHLGWDGHH